MKTQSTRRDFIKTAAIAGAAAGISIPEIVSAAGANAAVKKITLTENDVVLFQGDSITDWGRDHKKSNPNEAASLGNGYALLTASMLLTKYPEKRLQIYNKGVSGDKVYQLIDRWDADTLSLKPNVVSIHVGVNDFWHIAKHNYTGTIETYLTDYRKLINKTKEALPGVKLVICEPFAVGGVKEVDGSWYPAFDKYRKAAKDIAAEFNAAFVPWQSTMDKAMEKASPSYWSIDGVHPTLAGAELMAAAWMEAVQG